MSIEKWKQSKMCPDYEVNEHGVVRNIKTGKIINPIDKPDGQQIGLWVNTYFKYYKLGDIVADAFYDDNHVGMRSVYKNNNCRDNRPENLEWKVPTTLAAYRDTEVRCKETGIDYYNIYDCGEELGIRLKDIALSINEQQPVKAKDGNWYTFERIN